MLRNGGLCAHGALVGGAQLEAPVVDHRCGRFDAHQGPRAQADVTPVGSLRRGGCGPGTAITALAVSCVPGNTTSAAQAGSAATAGRNGPSFVPGCAIRPRMPRGRPKLVQQLRGPTAAAPDCRTGVVLASVISLHFTPVSSQWIRSGISSSVSATSSSGEPQLHRQQLIERVELHELQAGVAENLFAGDEANAFSIMPLVRLSR